MELPLLLNVTWQHVRLLGKNIGTWYIVQPCITGNMNRLVKHIILAGSIGRGGRGRVSKLSEKRKHGARWEGCTCILSAWAKVVGYAKGPKDMSDSDNESVTKGSKSPKFSILWWKHDAKHLCNMPQGRWFVALTRASIKKKKIPLLKIDKLHLYWRQIIYHIHVKLPHNMFRFTSDSL